MRPTIHTFIAILATISAFVYFNLGMDYINIGHGLHPMLSLPVATVMFLIACFSSKLVQALFD